MTLVAPIALYEKLDGEFGFEADACTLGLDADWTGVCWMVPPYGRAIGKWLEKAKKSAEAGATVVCLVPARTDTRWWFNTCRFTEVRFLHGRLKFGNSQSSAPFPSAVVICGRPAKVVWWDWHTDEMWSPRRVVWWDRKALEKGIWEAMWSKPFEKPELL
jgi:hypothetical protein